MKTSHFVSAVIVISAMFLASCANTVRGVGKDVNNTADAVEDVVN